MKRMTMELGGHAPVIVAADANPAQAAQVIASAKFRNAGQICACPTRFLVHNAIKDEFVAALVAYAESLQVGNGLETGTQMGPLANPRRVAAMRQLTEDAIARGARLVTGGTTQGTKGNFFNPTVISDAPIDSALWNEEPFSPVAAVRGFDQLEEAIAEANRLPYGLAAYAFTPHAATQFKLIDRLQAGIVWINHAAPAWPEMPFGGVRDSGIGSEGGIEALEPYLVTKSVSILHTGP